MVRPVVREFRVHVGACAASGRCVHGRHPLQTSDALGAAAVAESANRQTPVGQDPAVFERGEQASSPKRPIAPKGV